MVGVAYLLAEVLDEPIPCGAARMLERLHIGVKMTTIQNHQAFGFKRAIICGKGLIGYRKMVADGNHHQ